MKAFLTILVLVGLISSPLKADIHLLPFPISVKEDINKLNYFMFEMTLEDPDLKKRGLMLCAEIEELEGTLLCVSGTKAYMNQAFSRASLFSEGRVGAEKGRIYELDSQEVLAQNEALGNNIPSDEIRGFWDTLAKTCPTSGNCTSPEELELYEKVMIPMSFKRSQFITITQANDAVPYVVLSHELKHAQYFWDNRFRETVDRFWNETVTEEDRERVRNELGKYYNKNDEAVMRNEFQAFLLERHASMHTLKDFVPLYQDKLIQKLREAGVELIDSK